MSEEDLELYNEIKEQYNSAKTLNIEYKEYEAAQEALVAAQGIMDKSLLSFDFSYKNISDAYEKANDTNNLSADGLNSYIERVSDNKELINSISNDISTYLNDIAAALLKIEEILEEKHDNYINAYNLLMMLIAGYPRYDEVSQFTDLEVID